MERVPDVIIENPVIDSPFDELARRYRLHTMTSSAQRKRGGYWVS
jgi:hypothetical protein